MRIALLFSLALTITVMLLPAHVFGQDSSRQKNAVARAKAPASPRTPWGDPNLQGTYNFDTYTPLERPKEFAGKAFFTEEEAAAYLRQRQEQFHGQPKTDIHYDDATWQKEARTKGLVGLRTSLIVDPPDGRMPPLTREWQLRDAERAEALRQGPADGPEKRSLSERCLVGFNAGPPMLPRAYNNNVQLLQGPGHVIILNETATPRIVILDGRPHLGTRIRQWRGDSRGSWDGETLIVDNTNFTRHGTGMFGLPSGDESIHVIERFTRIDVNTLRYEFTINDPTAWTGPWSAEIPLSKVDAPLYEYACHEGNYGLSFILSAARAEERSAGVAKDAK